MANRSRAATQLTPYDPALDVIVHKFWAHQTGPTSGTRLVLRQYNGGEIKLAYEKCWRDRKGGDHSKAERIPARVLVEAGIVSSEIEAAAKVERKSAPPVAEETPASPFVL